MFSYSKFCLDVADTQRNRFWFCCYYFFVIGSRNMVERLSDRAETVCNKLLSNHNIKVKRDWIVDCVKFFISQSAIINDETLYQQALQQFLLADIKEASNTVIPAMIQQKREAFTLNGIFVLQLNFLIDICI